jgi:hypothetical protein
VVTSTRDRLAAGFEQASRAAVEECRRFDYHPTVWVSMMDELGAVEAAKRLLLSPDVQSGFERLTEQGRVDLTIEFAVLNPVGQVVRPRQARSGLVETPASKPAGHGVASLVMRQAADRPRRSVVSEPRSIPALFHPARAPDLKGPGGAEMLTTLVLHRPCDSRIYLEAGAYFDDSGRVVTHNGDEHRRPRPRPPLPAHARFVDSDGMTHAQLVEEVRAIDGLIDVTGGCGDRPNCVSRQTAAIAPAAERIRTQDRAAGVLPASGRARHQRSGPTTHREKTVRRHL